MATLNQILNLRPVKGDVGVEIEVEGRNLPDSTPLWRRDRDGSLKGEYDNYEYVMRVPSPIEELKNAFQELKTAFEIRRAKVDNTYRAGVHVHVNVQDFTITQLMNYVTLFLIMEECLVDFCEPSRRGNHFCLRAKDAGYFTHLLWKTCEEGDLRMLDNEDIRYSAMNLNSLFKYGSVEFRALESTQDFDKIETWSNMLFRLKVAATKFENPIKIMEAISGEGFEGFVREIMGEWFPIIKGQDGWQRKVREGVLNSQDLAYSRKWNTINLNIFKKDDIFA